MEAYSLDLCPEETIAVYLPTDSKFQGKVLPVAEKVLGKPVGEYKKALDAEKNKSIHETYGDLIETTKNNLESLEKLSKFTDNYRKEFSKNVVPLIHDNAEKIFNNDPTEPDLTKGATFFYNPKGVKQTPKFAKDKEPVYRSKNHLFFSTGGENKNKGGFVKRVVDKAA